jgi:hypothetical protein
MTVARTSAMSRLGQITSARCPDPPSSAHRVSSHHAPKTAGGGTNSKQTRRRGTRRLREGIEVIDVAFLTVSAIVLPIATAFVKPRSSSTRIRRFAIWSVAICITMLFGHSAYRMYLFESWLVRDETKYNELKHAKIESAENYDANPRTQWNPSGRLYRIQSAENPSVLARVRRPDLVISARQPRNAMLAAGLWAIICATAANCISMLKRRFIRSGCP